MKKIPELTWPDKSKVLLGFDKGGMPIWGTGADLKPVTLKEIEAFGRVNGQTPKDLFSRGDNLLIRGENLFVLKALEKDFSGKIKCIYIDPPYNTGNNLREYYDDLPHGLWLSMMKSRLEVLKGFLRSDGFIFVHIDSKELGYLRVLMDEIFGRGNFITQISWQRSPQRTVLGQGQKPIITILEYLLLYAKDASSATLNRVKKRIKATEKVMGQYRVVVEHGGKGNLVKEFSNENNSTPVRIWELDNFKIENLPAGTTRGGYLKKFDSLYQSVSIHKEHSFIQKVLAHLEPSRAYLVQYTPSRGKSAGKEVSEIFINNRKMLPARSYADVGDDGELYRTVDMDNLWTDEEIGVTGTAREGEADFRRGKKPEALLKRVIELSTSPGDWVLDCFLGSGTTAAVAHKMKRRWIGIEVDNRIENIALLRIKRVVEGTDRTGVSKRVGRIAGDSGFRYFTASYPHGERIFPLSDRLKKINQTHEKL